MSENEKEAPLADGTAGELRHGTNPDPVAPEKNLGPLTQAELSALVIEEGKKPKGERDPRIVRLVATVAMVQAMLGKEINDGTALAEQASQATAQLAFFQSLLVCETQRRGGLLSFPRAALDELTGREQLDVRTAKDGGVTLALRNKIITGGFGGNG